MSRLPALAAACGALMLATAPALAQERTTVVVVGEGQAETPPDRFVLDAEIEGRGADQAEAVRRMTESHTTVSDAVTRLRGLTSVEVTTGLPEVTPIYESGCNPAAFGRGAPCPINGYVASMALNLEAGPAERAGDAVSIAAERGARSVRLSRYALSDEAAAQRNALRDAYADARRQAEDIAAASGGRIVAVVRADATPDNRRTSALIGANFIDPDSDWVSYAEAQSPTTGISVSPEPIRTVRRLTVTFAVE